MGVFSEQRTKQILVSPKRITPAPPRPGGISQNGKIGNGLLLSYRFALWAAPPSPSNVHLAAGDRRHFIQMLEACTLYAMPAEDAPVFSTQLVIHRSLAAQGE